MKLAARGAVAALALGIAGCAWFTNLYPDTDVVEPKGFELRAATGVQKSGGLLQAGALEYAGKGDVVAAHRKYIDAMKGEGWVTANDEIGAESAFSTLRKDNRTCTVQFARANEKVRVTVKVGPTK